MFTNSPLREYENIILTIMDKIEKNPEVYEVNGEVEIPYEMGEFLSELYKNDIEHVNEVFKEVMREVTFDEKNNDFVTLTDILLEDSTRLNASEDLKLEEFIKVLGWNQNKFYENVRRICSEDVYNIDIGKFKKAGETKEDYYNDERNFCFKKEWSDIAILLFKMFAENPYYRANSKPTSASLDSVIEYNEKFLEAIKNEINKYNSLEIQLHPAYSSTYAETLAMKKVKEKIQLFFTLISKVPIESRANMWLELSNKIDEIIIKNYVLSKQAKEEVEKDKGELFKNQMYGEYEHISLDKYIAQLLKNEMNPTFREERLEINRKKHVWMKIFDKVSIRLDSVEEVNKVNKIWNQTNGERNKIVSKINELEIEIKKQLKDKENLVNRITDINENIDRVIENQKKFGDTENVKILKELKETLLKTNNSIGDFEKVIENVIQEVNFNVMNRK